MQTHDLLGSPKQDLLGTWRPSRTDPNFKDPLTTTKGRETRALLGRSRDLDSDRENNGRHSQTQTGRQNPR